MMGMHGEAWVNTAIQEADLLIALGMRFDDRVTGNLRTYALNAKKIHVDIDRAELNKNVRVDVAIAKDLRGAIAEWLPGLARNARATWLAHIGELKGDSAVRDIQNLPDNGHLYAAHVINDLWRLTDGECGRGDRRRPAPDVGGAVLQARDAALAHHLGRPRHDGFRVARGHRRQDGVPGGGSLGRRRRRRLPDDDVRAGDGRAGGPRPQHLHREQRLSRDGPAVAGVLLRQALRRHADHGPGLREAGGRIRDLRARPSIGAPMSRTPCSRPAATTACRSSISAWSRKIPCTRWSPPARICTR